MARWKGMRPKTSKNVWQHETNRQQIEVDLSSFGDNIQMNQYPISTSFQTASGAVQQQKLQFTQWIWWSEVIIGKHFNEHVTSIIK